MAVIDNLISYYKLDEASGNRADSHGANTLTDNNTVGSGTGKINSASDHIRANNEFLSATSNWVTNAWTVSGWFNTDGIPVAEGHTLWSFRPGAGAANLMQAETGNDHKIRVIAFDSTGSVKRDYKSSVTLTDGAFKHIVVTWDGTNLKMYFDGTEDTSITKTIDLAMTQTYTSRVLRIGAELSGSNIWNGLIDEVGIWDAAKSAAEVTSLYNSGAAFAYPFSSAAGPANLKSLDTNVKANIISINGNLIANCKSYNTNV